MKEIDLFRRVWNAHALSHLTVHVMVCSVGTTVVA